MEKLPVNRGVGFTSHPGSALVKAPQFRILQGSIKDMSREWAALEVTVHCSRWTLFIFSVWRPCAEKKNSVGTLLYKPYMKVAVIPSDCRVKALLNTGCSSGPQFSVLPEIIKDGEHLSFHLPVWKQEWCSSAAFSFIVWKTMVYYLLSCASFKLLVGGLTLNINIKFLFCTTGKFLWHHHISTWELPMHSLKSLLRVQMESSSSEHYLSVSRNLPVF